MQTALFYLALATTVLWVVLYVEMWLGIRSTGYLQKVTLANASDLPRVSVIIPACNEERNIEEALQSVLSQDYKRLEIIVINDRSTDSTGDILARMAQRNPRLCVLHVKGLPPGWLGKNHALHFGAIHATGELILFTDADIVMEPSAISRAVRYLTEKELDHLAVLMEARMPGVVLGMFALGFGVFFSIYSRFWRARNPRSGAHVGIGGFNLIRAEVYCAVGGHRPIAMRPDDDMKLGKLIKQSGYRQDLLFGRGLMYVEWYASLAELVRGLEKNTFAGVGYSVFQLVASSVALLAFAVLPFAAVFFAQGATRGLYLFTSLSIIAMSAYGARMQNIKPWYAVGFPLISLLFLFIVWRSAVLTLLNGGINWRGTHYSLAELRENKL